MLKPGIVGWKAAACAIGFCAVLSGCSIHNAEKGSYGPFNQIATLTPRTSTYADLVNLPRPRGKLVAAVYNLRDQSGQYRPAPASSFSTAVTQGASAMLVNALNASNWFVVLEREGLQNLLTERKIIRAAQKKPDVPQNNANDLPSLLAANILLEGGVVAYETNLHTGGLGARYLGYSLSGQYQVDQVTVNLRAVDIRTGQVLTSIMTTKAIVSAEVQAGIFKFIETDRLLEVEAGLTTNEPAQLCVLSAIEASVAYLVVDGIEKNFWALNNPDDRGHPAIVAYARELHSQRAERSNP